MKTIKYYDFSKCNLCDLEDIYCAIDEDLRKQILGEAVCNWLISGHEVGGIDDETFRELMGAFFPEPVRVEHRFHINHPTRMSKNRSALSAFGARIRASMNGLLAEKTGVSLNE